MKIDAGELTRIRVRMEDVVNSLNAQKSTLNTALNAINQNMVVSGAYSVTPVSRTISDNFDRGIKDAINNIDQLCEFIDKQVASYGLTIEDAYSALNKFMADLQDKVVQYNANNTNIAY